MVELSRTTKGIIVDMIVLSMFVFWIFVADIFILMGYGVPLLHSVNFIEFIISFLILIFILIVVNVLYLPITFIFVKKFKKVNFGAPKRIIFDGNEVRFIRHIGKETVPLCEFQKIVVVQRPVAEEGFLIYNKGQVLINSFRFGDINEFVSVFNTALENSLNIQK